MLVGGFRFRQLAGEGVDVEMTLTGAVDAIRPVQARVEPLRRIRRGHLARQHEAQFVMEGAGVFLGVEILALPAPVGPRAGEAVEHVGGGLLRAVAGFLGQGFQRVRVGDRAPQERGDVVLLDLLEDGGDAGLAEIFLRENVAGDLTPVGRDVDAVLREHDGAVGVANFALGLAEREFGVGRLIGLGVTTFDPHLFDSR